LLIKLTQILLLINYVIIYLEYLAMNINPENAVKYAEGKLSIVVTIQESENDGDYIGALDILHEALQSKKHRGSQIILEKIMVCIILHSLLLTITLA
jgi:hypothetical protein